MALSKPNGGSHQLQLSSLVGGVVPNVRQRAAAETTVAAAMPSAALSSVARESMATATYSPGQFVEYDLTKRQRLLLVTSVFVTALLVTYLTGIRPGFRNTGFYVTVLRYAADGVGTALMLPWRICSECYEEFQSSSLLQ